MNDPVTQARIYREQILSTMLPQKSDLERIMKHGPKAKNDYALLAAALAFTLGELSDYEAAQKLPPHKD